MRELADKHIILGITGGIAAYKSAELARLFVKQGATVQVVMTSAATEFVSPLTFQAITSRKVRIALFDQDAEAGMGHIELARWADLIVIAPATANSLAKIVYGMADNLLTTLVLASNAVKVVAPAMNQQMWQNEATQTNASILKKRGYYTIGPASGEQACGDMGWGRMQEPHVIADFCVKALSDVYERQSETQSDSTQDKKVLKGKKLVITAGATIEDIDPVRYLTNRSSGKMGFAVARAAVEAGAEVILISGPVALDEPYGCQLSTVRSAADMQQAVIGAISDADIFIAAAAVADYRPKVKKRQKIKKQTETLTIELVKTPDILAEVSAQYKNLFTVGFAAETENLAKYARSKLEKKNLDMVAANLVGEDKGFEQDNNELHLFWKTGDRVLAHAAKTTLAKQLVVEIAQRLSSSPYKSKKGNSE
jgi:phosphopantothenoylcysteine decarboxylase/phosphopantothenate--cysteine ligase